MHTAGDLWIAFNSFFLDLAPVAALAALAVSFFLRKKQADRQERALRERIDMYSGGGEPLKTADADHITHE